MIAIHEDLNFGGHRLLLRHLDLGNNGTSETRCNLRLETAVHTDDALNRTPVRLSRGICCAMFRAA